MVFFVTDCKISLFPPAAAVMAISYFVFNIEWQYLHKIVCLAEKAFVVFYMERSSDYRRKSRSEFTYIALIFLPLSIHVSSFLCWKKIFVCVCEYCIVSGGAFSCPQNYRTSCSSYPHTTSALVITLTIFFPCKCVLYFLVSLSNAHFFGPSLTWQTWKHPWKRSECICNKTYALYAGNTCSKSSSSNEA